MLLSISDNKTISDLQDKFNECFPHLKLEFYHKKHKLNRASLEEQRIKEDLKISEIRKKQNSGTLEIKSWDKTGDLEQRFREEYGLYVQIFRLENGRWVQSVKTDELTLAEQSVIAEANKTDTGNMDEYH
jgi:hypothetical protein